MAELAMVEPLRIAHHGARCCVLARTWLECLDSTFHRGAARAAPPAWISHRFAAGATHRPLHWCEIPDAALDDTAAAALGRELWGLRSEGIRAVQLRDDQACREAIGVERDGRLLVWCGGGWLTPRPAGRAVAVRVVGAEAALVQWGDRRLRTGSWTAVQLGLPLASHGSRSAS